MESRLHLDAENSLLSCLIAARGVPATKIDACVKSFVADKPLRYPTRLHLELLLAPYRVTASEHLRDTGVHATCSAVSCSWVSSTDHSDCALLAPNRQSAFV